LSFFGLTQHANAIHHGRKTLSKHTLQRLQQSRQITEYASERPLFLTLTISALNFEMPNQTDNIEDIELEETLEDVDRSFLIAENEPHYDLRSQTTESAILTQIEEDSEESSDESLLQEAEHIDVDLEDLQGATFEDALETIEGKNKPAYLAEWPNEAYRDFMELVIEGNISNKIGDKIIKFFNKYSNLQKSPLPGSTKSGKEYLNNIQSPSIKFKEKVVATYSGVDFILHYRPIFRAIQALLQRPGVTDGFILRGVLRKEKVGLTSLIAAEGTEVIIFFAGWRS